MAFETASFYFLALTKQTSILLLVVLFLAISCDNSSDMVAEIESAIEIPQRIVTKEDSLLLKDRQGKLHYEGRPYSGYIIEYFANKNIRSKKGFNNGLLEGNSILYFPNGNQESKRPYKNGEKHGEHFGWYKDGQMKFHYNFVKGLSEGNHKDWYPDGNLFKDFNYKKGKPFGAQKVWRKDGKIRANYVIRENGKKYGLSGLKRCAKIDTKNQNIDPYKGAEQ